MHMTSTSRRMAPRATRGTEHSGQEIWIALGLSAGAMVALGFSRFAYALLLPSMRADLGWSFTAAGGMNTANAAGYILGAATAAWWARRFSARTAFAGGMAISALALLLSGTTDNYTALCVIRLVGGVSTAVTFVLGSALAAHVHTGGSHRRSALLVSVYMTGVGLGIVGSGIIVPSVLAHSGSAAWNIGWILMGLVAVALVVPAAWAVRRVPPPQGSGSDASRPSFRPLTALFAWYVLFGAGYVSYMTFVVALLHHQDLGLGQEAAFFIILGAASAAATLLFWGRVIGRLRGGQAPMVISLVVLVGVLPVLLGDGLGAALLSAVIFGSSFMAGPTAATVLARRMLPPHGWTAGIAALTVAFSVGQAIGPLLAGALSDTSGGVELGFWLSVALLAIAACVAIGQRDAASHPASSATENTEPMLDDPKRETAVRPGDRKTFTHILVAIDGTPQGRRVLETAAQVASLSNAAVRVLHVDAAYAAYDTAYDLETELAATSVVHDAVADLRSHGISADGLLSHEPEADIDDVILATAREQQADLIVLGTNRHHGIGSWLENSVSDQVAHRAVAAVLLVS